jgi:hypothetical protein
MHAKHANSDRLNDLSRRVIGCAFTVLNTLGAGFPGKGPMRMRWHLNFVRGRRLPNNTAPRYYHDVVVGEYFVDRSRTCF